MTEMSSLKVPKDLGEITPCWLTKALNGNREPAGPSVTGYSAETIAEGKGFMNQLFQLTLEYDSDSTNLPRTVIAKLPSADPLLRMVSDRLGQNRREVRFYHELADSVHLETPRSYYRRMDPATGDTVLLLEDMSYAQQGDSVAGCSIDEARRCIGQLARFQASWWDSPLLDRLSWMPLKEAEAGAYQEIYAGAWMSLLEKAVAECPKACGWWGTVWPRKSIGSRPSSRRPPVLLFTGTTGSTIASSPQLRAPSRWLFSIGSSVEEAAAPTMPPPSSARRSLRSGERRRSWAFWASTTPSWREMASRVTRSKNALYDYRLSMLEILVFWIVTGGYCNYEGERAAAYLRNSLERFDAAVSDLGSTETVDLNR